MDSSCSHCENSNHALSSWTSYNILIVEYREVTAQTMYFSNLNLPLLFSCPRDETYEVLYCGFSLEKSKSLSKTPDF